MKGDSPELERAQIVKPHIGDVVPTSRLQGYLDAICATCATFLVIPIKDLSADDADPPVDSLSDFLATRRFELVMFFIGFFIISVVWESFVRRFTIIKKLDDFLLFLMIISMLATTMLPFSLSMQGHYTSHELTTGITCAILLVLEVIEVIMIIYAFSYTQLLHEDMQRWDTVKLHRVRNLACVKSIVNSGLIIVAGLCSLIHYSVSWFIMIVIILVPLIEKLVLYVRRHHFRVSSAEQDAIFERYLKGNIDKERVETMSDAAVAIAACLLVLDITTEEFPSQEAVDTHGVGGSLKEMATSISAYVGAFVCVSLLWYVNHCILHHFHTINVLLLYLQKVFLAGLSLTPLSAKLTKNYGNEKSADEKVAHRFAVLYIFIAGLANVLMLSVGYIRQEKVLHTWALTKKDFWRANKKHHLYVWLKTVTIPFWTLVIIFVSFAHQKHVFILVNVFYGVMLMSFILLKLGMACTCCGRQRNDQTLEKFQMSPTSSTSQYGDDWNVKPGVLS